MYLRKLVTNDETKALAKISHAKKSSYEGFIRAKPSMIAISSRNDHRPKMPA